MGAVVLGTLAAFGVLLVGLGAGLIFIFKNQIHQKINEAVPLVNGSESYNTWLDPPAPVYMQFWMFNVENAWEIINRPGTVPIVTEMGPYTYLEVRPKKDLQFTDNGTMLSYKQPKSYIFQPDLSAGLENDTFVSVNLPILTVASKVAGLPETVQEMIADALWAAGEELFEEYTVGGYLWGYEEKSIKKINEIIHVFHFNKTFQQKFGLFYGQNGTDDGLYTIFTGSHDVQLVNIINSWNNEKYLTFWNTTYCNMINGTDGSQWHPYIDKKEDLYLFSSDICRSIYVQFEQEIWLKGISLHRFVPPAAVFANHTENPENEGFCTDKCYGSGVLDVSPCKGAPIFMSQPHFYQGAPEYINAVRGMKPNKEDHETFLDVEPYTGAAMRLAKRLQINAHIQKFKAFLDTKNINPIIFPIAWLNESAEVTDAGAHKFIKQVLDPVKVTEAVQYSVMVLGMFILICVLILIFRKMWQKNRKDEPLLDPSEAKS